MQVIPVPCLKDNYAYLVVCDATGETAIVDPSEAEPVEAALKARGRRPSAIWCTHHHTDHVGGNEELKARYDVPVLGHGSDKARLPGLSRAVAHGDSFTFGKLLVRVLHIPGHTLGAVAYVVHEGDRARAVFTGDTMFLGGCGRLFEGTPAQMHGSLSLLGALGDDVEVYCGHEYTESNLRFAHHVEPGNQDVVRVAEASKAKRAAGEPTVPGTVGTERLTNPFLRVGSAEIRQNLGIPKDAPDEEALGLVRKAKDTF